MKDKYIITKSEGRVLTALLQQGRIVTLDYEEIDSVQLNNIYIGKVKNILSNINAAFIEIGNGQICYYSLEDNRNPIYTQRTAALKKRLMQGDELIVQIAREGVKTKAPVVTSHLNFTGKYVVLTAGKTTLGISNKITSKKWKEMIKDLLQPHLSEEYGFIIRTNARNVEVQVIVKECLQLIDRFETIKREGQYRTCYSCLAKAAPSYISGIRDLYEEKLEKIITDDEKIYNEVKTYFSLQDVEFLNKLELYQDSLLPIGKLYSLETAMERALNGKVWLKSGGYLVIQPTEALVVIDVNTGKYSGNKKLQETLLKINLEAAEEIAYQIRLRNLSGIIVVDFIDLAKQEDKDNLMERLDHILKRDPIKTTLVGMSKLGLVEMTRKKIRKPFYEQIK